LQRPLVTLAPGDERDANAIQRILVGPEKLSFRLIDESPFVNVPAPPIGGSSRLGQDVPDSLGGGGHRLQVFSVTPLLENLSVFENEKGHLPMRFRNGSHRVIAQPAHGLQIVAQSVLEEFENSQYRALRRANCLMILGSQIFQRSSDV